MKRISNLLKTSALTFVIAGSAFAQDVVDYKWRADINNHGWMIGSPGPASTIRAQRFATDAAKWVTININHVAQIDNIDQGDMLGANDADFYAMIWVDGQVFKTKNNFSEDDGNPNWKLRVPVYGDTSTIRIRLMDDDGGLEQKDDHADINPAGDAKDLILHYNSKTGAITGDLTGTANTWIKAKGDGDDDKAWINFSIS